MTSPSWDPAQYERFAEERARPFTDLVAQIPTARARDVVDLGCGPGTMTATLRERWPGAHVHGIDSSTDMIAAAQRHATDRLTFEETDILDWVPERASYDVIVSNATLQWLPEHVDLLPAWVRALRRGGSLAFQVPAPGSAGAGQVFRAVANAPRWSDRLARVATASGPQGRSPVRTPTEYVELLAPHGTVNVWETTYSHVLDGPDPVLEWFAGTGLRPYLDALDEVDRPDFVADIAKGLREQYPQRPFGTILPFRRIFAVVVV
jgi:trans-aconitate 2-methyltransferase